MRSIPELYSKSVELTKSLCRRTMNPHSVHVFGLGAEKSGTHSIQGVFASEYISHHEAHSKHLIPLIIDYKQNGNKRKLVQALQRLDLRFYPEVEVAHYYGEIPEILCEVFPNAKFVLTLRDCFSWFESVLSQNLMVYDAFRRDGTSARYMHLYRYRYGEHFSYANEEAILDSKGLPNAEAYFTYWTRFNSHIMATVPSDRLLVVRTRDIADRLDDISTFLGIPRDTLNVNKSHSFKRKKYKISVDNSIPKAFIKDQAQVCRPIMDKYFPGKFEAY